MLALMAQKLEFSGYFDDFSLYFVRKWLETGKDQTASTTIHFL
jgi:hypothetical protein